MYQTQKPTPRCDHISSITPCIDHAFDTSDDTRWGYRGISIRYLCSFLCIHLPYILRWICRSMELAKSWKLDLSKNIMKISVKNYETKFNDIALTLSSSIDLRWDGRFRRRYFLFFTTFLQKLLGLLSIRRRSQSITFASEMLLKELGLFRILAGNMALSWLPET